MRVFVFLFIDLSGVGLALMIYFTLNSFVAVVHILSYSTAYHNGNLYCQTLRFPLTLCESLTLNKYKMKGVMASLVAGHS